MVHQRHFGGKRCCCPNPAVPAPAAPKGADGAKAEVKGSGCFSGCIERFLARYYLPAMLKRVGPVKPLPLLFVAVMTAVAVQGTYFSSQLTPPSKPEEWFPENHMWTGFQEFVSTTYYSPDYERFNRAWLVWGVSGMNFDDFNQYKPDDFPAKVKFDPAFDLSTSEAQRAFLDTCREIRRLGCSLPGCRSKDKTFVLKVGNQEAVSCVLEDFQRWLAATRNISVLPTGPTFLSLFSSFRDTASHKDYGDKTDGALAPDYKKNIGFIKGHLSYVAIEMRVAMLRREPYGTGVEVRKLADRFVEDRKAAMPASMKSLTVASRSFADFDLGQELVSGLFSGMAIAGPLVFAVLLFSTRNIVLSLYAVLSVTGIVVCVLGFCKQPMDYDLGVGEAIAGIIVIGFSVDYVVHFAHMYCEGARSGLQTRDERAAFTIEKMGSTVFAGAITTAGSGIFMFFCFLTFFTKMATLICMTIVYSFLFALCMFMGLCFLIGPEGNFGNICCCFPARGAVQEPKTQAQEDAPESGAASEAARETQEDNYEVYV